MNDNLTLQISVIIKAPLQKVWDAIVNPEIIRQYLFGTEAISDWKEGSSILYKGMWEGKSYEDKGIILELKTEKLFRYKYWSSMSGTQDLPENYAEITYELSEGIEGVTFLLIQKEITTQQQLEHLQSNWQMVLNGMKQLLEQ